MNRTLTSIAVAPSLVLQVPVLRAVLRIGAGGLFLQHGAQKLFGLLGGMGGSGASAELFSLMGLAGVLEFFGGLLIVLGLLTRPVAAVLMLVMIAAYFMGHAGGGVLPIQNGGELAVLYALIFAYITAAGPGAWSLGRRRAPEHSL